MGDGPGNLSSALGIQCFPKKNTLNAHIAQLQAEGKVPGPHALGLQQSDRGVDGKFVQKGAGLRRQPQPRTKEPHTLMGYREEEDYRQHLSSRPVQVRLSPEDAPAPAAALSAACRTTARAGLHMFSPSGLCARVPRADSNSSTSTPPGILCRAVAGDGGKRPWHRSTLCHCRAVEA